MIGRAKSDSPWLISLVLFCDWLSDGRLLYGISSGNGGDFCLLLMAADSRHP